jgi:signal transduction histidine kinase
VEHDADAVVQAARQRAEATLHAARMRADTSTRVTPSEAARRDVERAREDTINAQERATADERLHIEREERQRALSELLRFERDATDDRLLIERTQADDAVRSRDDFLGMVNHDLRTLLGGIALNAALLAKQASERGPEHAGYVRHAERIQRFTGRMNRLVGDLLDVVSLEAGKLEVTPRPLDPKQLVRDTAEAFQPLFSAKGIAFHTNVAADSFLAAFDHDRILQVLANLLSNALKFTDEGGEVVVRVAPVGSEVCFTVTDTGVGIPPDKAENIFERFQQVSTKDRRGLGLGLYIAKCIVSAHGGRIWLENHEGSGSAFHFTLPGLPPSA